MQFVNGDESGPPLSIDEETLVCMQHALWMELVVPSITEFWIRTNGPAPTQDRPQDESPSMPMPVELILLFVIGVALQRFWRTPQLFVVAPDAVASERFIVALQPPE